ncbi:hypothetical protein Tco_1033909 [Tanacetum coccineum]
MASSANSSTQNPPRKVPRTDFIDLSSNESSPIKNIPINTTLDTTLALTIPPLIISQTILSQGTNVSPLAPRALVFSTPPSSLLEPHPYLATLDDLPPRNSNLPPPLLPQGHSQGLSQELPILTPMEFEPSFPPINLSISRITWKTFGGNTYDLGSILEETGQECNFTQRRLEELLTKGGDGVRVTYDDVWMIKRLRQKNL